MPEFAVTVFAAKEVPIEVEVGAVVTVSAAKEVPVEVEVEFVVMVSAAKEVPVEVEVVVPPEVVVPLMVTGRLFLIFRSAEAFGG